VRQRHGALHPPADAERLRIATSARQERAELARRGVDASKLGLDAGVSDAHRELLGQRAHLVRQALRRALLAQDGGQVVEIDLRLWMQRHQHGHAAAIDAQPEHGVATVRRLGQRLLGERELGDAIELGRAGRLAHEVDPLAVDALAVAQRRRLVGGLQVGAQSQGRQARSGAARPGQRALLELPSRPTVRVGGRPLRKVGVEVESRELESCFRHVRVAPGASQRGKRSSRAPRAVARLPAANANESGILTAARCRA
jgi:hypothetical protein